MKQALICSVALFMMTGLPSAHAETVQIKTKTQPIEVDSVREIPFSEFDVNQDGLYSKTEVGRKLFEVFDRDGNETIDNNEWEMRSIYTIVPMEKETYTFVDENNDGYVESSAYPYETFFQESGLGRFDDDKNGLSPQEFIDEGYQSLDDDDNNLIELDEWEEAYSLSVKPKAAEQDNYN